MDPFKSGLKGNQNEDLCKYNLHLQALFGEPINSYTKEALIKVIIFEFELHRGQPCWLARYHQWRAEKGWPVTRFDTSGPFLHF